MIIEFKSKILQNNQPNFIEFKAPVVVSSRDDFTVFEFADPKSKIMNMIEVSQDKVNIFAGTMSINLELQEFITTEYQTTHGNVYFVSFLKSLHQSEGKIDFAYSLMTSEKTLLGEYEISLAIFSELN